MKNILLALTCYLSSQVVFSKNLFHHEGYRSFPFIVKEKVESRCLTKISACSTKQKDASFLYQFTYGYKENRVIIFSNGKQSRYSVSDTEQVTELVSLSGLKTENANIANGGRGSKIKDEKSYALEVCKSEVERWHKTYDFCN